MNNNTKNRMLYMSHFFKKYLGHTKIKYHLYFIAKEKEKEKNTKDKLNNIGWLRNVGYMIAEKSFNYIFFNNFNLLPSEGVKHVYTEYRDVIAHVGGVEKRFWKNGVLAGILATYTYVFKLLNGFPINLHDEKTIDMEFNERIKNKEQPFYVTRQNASKGKLINEFKNDTYGVEWEKRNKTDEEIAKNKIKYHENWKENGLSNTKFEIVEQEVITNKGTKEPIDLNATLFIVRPI